MDEARKHIDAAYSALSRIPVTGDAVDLMSAARKELRAAYAALSKKDVGEADGR